MRWNKQKHPLGTTIWRKRFAFLPTELNSPKNETVWLEFYYEQLQYSEYGWLNQPYAWRVVTNQLEHPGVSLSKMR
jgi:hypothetical protein